MSSTTIRAAYTLLATGLFVGGCSGTEEKVRDTGMPPTGSTATGGGTMSSGGTQPVSGGESSPSSGGSVLVPTGGTTSTGGTSDCGSVAVQVTRPVPTVWLLVDGSGSMNDPFSGLGDARWSVLRNALLDPTTGLVGLAEKQVAFGLIIYDGGNSPPGVYIEGVCPRLIVVDPALNNLAAITGAYPQLPTGASTPTHYALEETSKRIAATPSIDGGPVALVLATDGHPNLCDFHDGIPTNAQMQQQAVDTVAALATRGTQTYVIALSEGDPTLKVHLDAVAQAGNTSTQTAFSPSSPADLASSLTAIVGDTIGCEFGIEGKIVAGKECEGSVELSGVALLCNDPNGYSVDSTGQLLSLSGEACESLRTAQSATLTASFPCEAVELY